MKEITQLSHRRGFTLVELMVVIAIMAILAVAGASGVVHMVPSYQQRACEEERAQAARVFVSDWMENRTLPTDDAGLNAWLNSYLSKTQVNCSHASDWTIHAAPASEGYLVTFACPVHNDDMVSIHMGQTNDDAGGIGWDGGFDPSKSSP